MSTHIHITSWVIGVLLFFVTYSMYKSKSPRARFLHRIVRFMNIIIILTGFLLFWGIMKTISNNYQMWYGFKMLGGLWVIASMEMILVRIRKGKSLSASWIQFIFAFLVVLYLGLRLPLGFHPFE